MKYVTSKLLFEVGSEESNIVSYRLETQHNYLDNLYLVPWMGARVEMSGNQVTVASLDHTALQADLTLSILQ